MVSVAILVLATAGFSWQEPLEIATGDAYQGPWRMNASDFRYVDDPTVAVNDAGMVAVAWVDQARKDVMLQLFDADGDARFDEPVNVSRSGGIFSWLPRLVVGAGDADEIYVLWQEIVFSGGSHGGEIFFARSTDGGRSFSEPLNLSNTTAGAGKGRFTRDFWHNGSLDLVQGPDGTLYAAWTEYEGALWLARSDDGGESFSAPRYVTGAMGSPPARGPALAVGDDGVVHLAWTVGETRDADIHYSRSDDAGASFARPRALHPGAGLADAPKLAVGADGRVHLAYTVNREVRYARSDDGGNSFGDPDELADRAGFPHLALHPGAVVVCWERFPSGGWRPQGLACTRSTDGGDSFAPPGIVPGSADPGHGQSGGRQGLLMRKLAVNAAGDLALVHSTWRDGESSRILLFHGTLRECVNAPSGFDHPMTQTDGFNDFREMNLGQGEWRFCF